MKVLKTGDGRTGWSTKADCTGAGNGIGGCGAKLLVEQADLFTTASCARDETTTYVTFMCCECGVETDVGNVPYHVRRGLPPKRDWVAVSKALRGGE